MYHDIVSDCSPDATGFSEPGANHYKISDDAFRSHLRALESAMGGHCTAGLVDQKDSRARPDITISFDDGGSGAMAALDGLAEFNRKAHFLIATDYVDKPGFLTRSEIREIAKCGHAVGSHSHTHIRNMMQQPDDIVVREWITSVKFLEDTIGSKVSVASVPYGSYAPRIATLAAAAGIQHLFTSEPSAYPSTINSVKVYGRYSITEKSSAKDVVSLVENRNLARQTQWTLWNARKIAKTVFSSAYSIARRSFRPS